MAIVRISPGRYQDTVTKKMYTAKTQAEAQAMATKATAPKAKTPVAPPVAQTPQQTATTQLGADVKAQDLGTVPGQVMANKQIADVTATEAQKYANAGTQINPYGTQTITKDEQGNTVVKQQLDAAQQKLMEADTNISQSGRNTAQQLQGQYNFGQGFNPQLAQRTTSGDLNANRSRIEDAVYSKLTKDTDMQQSRDREQLEQTLRNRGIPLGAQLYDDEFKKQKDQYQGYRDSARQQAIAQGGEEYTRDFNTNEQLIANQLSQAQGIRNQQIGEVNQFANTGTGLQAPQFQGYQGVNYSNPTGTDVYNSTTAATQGQQQIDIAKRQADAAIAKLRQGNSGGNQQKAPAAAPSPFNNTTAPGV